MKNLYFCILFIVFASFFVGCKDTKKQAEIIEQDSIVYNVEEISDQTLYGRCGDGSAMHTLELITDAGDTLYFVVNDDSVSNVKGGMAAGDRVAVMVDPDSSDEDAQRALEVINLTTLLGKWVSLDKSFELQEGGVIISNVKEPKPYVEWKILNGQLVLSADTFKVFELGVDTLMLENEKGIFAYKRLK